MTKKTLYLFSILIFCCFSCEEEEKNSLGNAMDYQFTITLNGTTHKVQGNTSDVVPIAGMGSSNNCYAINSSGSSITINLTIDDVSSSNYVSGQNLGFIISFNNLLLGNSDAQILIQNPNSNSYMSSFFNGIGAEFTSELSSSSTTLTNETPFTFNITDLGTNTVPNIASPNFNDWYTWGETLKGNFSGTAYAKSSSSSWDMDVPFQLEIDFEVIRNNY